MMRCVRCGYCCHHYPVVIISDPEKGFVEGNFEVHKGNGEPCKYLKGGKPGEYECTVHTRPWYEDTPCARHATIFGDKIACQLGEHILSEE